MRAGQPRRFEGVQELHILTITPPPTHLSLLLLLRPRASAAHASSSLVLLLPPRRLRCLTTSHQGLLKGFDQTTNVILHEAHERVFSVEDGVKLEALGLTVLRGDNIAIIGELDQERDALVDLSAVRAEPLAPVVH